MVTALKLITINTQDCVHRLTGFFRVSRSGSRGSARGTVIRICGSPRSSLAEISLTDDPLSR